MPRVSVLMSVYNGEPYLAESIESILNQSYEDFEFLIVDDGSTDTSLTTVPSIDDRRIRVVRNGSNIGLAASLNRGFRLARGEFPARQDADNISHRNRLSRQVKYLDDNPDVMHLGTRYWMIAENRAPLGTAIKKLVELIRILG